MMTDDTEPVNYENLFSEEAYIAVERERDEAKDELESVLGLLVECQGPLAAHALNAETPFVRGAVLALVRRIEVKLQKPRAT